jgi:hypothetical protein
VLSFFDTIRIVKSGEEELKMAEFYEPMLYMSTPEHPNTMGAYIVVKEPIDGDILRNAVEDLRARFPYFYVKVVSFENDLIVEDNSLPMTVRNTWEPIKLNSKESNFHLAAWKFEGRKLAFEISHSLTDGAGVLPYIKSTMFLYLSRRYGMSFETEGFRLPGDTIPISETGNPFEELDIDGAEEPMYTREAITDFYRFSEGTHNDPFATFVKIPESQMMQYCRDYDGSPNTFLAVMFARAVRHYDPDSDKTVSVSIAIDHKAMIGNHDNYRMFANALELEFTKDRSLEDIAKNCTMARGQVMLQASPENSLWAMKQRKATYVKLSQVPLDTKLGMIAKSAGSLRWSIAISYADSRSFGPLDPYIDELYLLSEPGVTDVVCEVACINHYFFLCIARTFPSEKFTKVFLDELSKVGIDYEVTGTEPFHLCGMEEYRK